MGCMPPPETAQARQSGVAYQPLQRLDSHQKAATIGIDLTKKRFQLHGVDGHGKIFLKKQVKREQTAMSFANLASALVDMGTCGDVHYWARKLLGTARTVGDPVVCQAQSLFGTERR